MILDATTRKLQVVLSEAKTTNDCAVVASWFDSGTTPTGGPQLANTNGVTAVDVVSAPASGYIRQVNELTVFNADTVSHGVTVRFNDNATLYTIIKASLLTGETLTYSKSLGWHTLDASGNLKQSLSGTTANLTDYATGTWTPFDASGASLTFTGVSAQYTKIGNRVFADFQFTFPSTANGANNVISGLPYANTAANSTRQGNITFPGNGTAMYAVIGIGPLTTFNFFGSTGNLLTNANLSTLTIIGSMHYQTA